MSELSEVFSGGYEIELKDKVYKYGEITLADLADMQRQLNKQHRENVLAVAKEIYQDKIPDHVYQDALRAVPLSEIEENMEAMAFIIWKAFQKFNPSLTKDEVTALMTFKQMKIISENLFPAEEKKT